MKKNITPGIATIMLLASIHSPVLGQQTYHIIKTFHIASEGGWDYLKVRPESNLLYVSHGTRVNILDKTSGDSIGVIENTTGVHGIAFYQAGGKGYTSNGRLNNVTVFNLQHNAEITQIATGENPDAILYEPFSKKIITCNGRSHDLSVIDPEAGKVISTIPVGGKPETAVSDEAGRLFVNIEDKSEIVVVDLKAFKVTAHWPLAPAEEPTGLAIDRKSNRLFAGCGNKMLAIVNTSTGALVKTLSIGGGCDGVAFDEDTHTIFTSNGEGTMSVFRENSGNDFGLVAKIPTKRGARTIALDPQTHWIYLPTADFNPPDPAAPQARPKMIAGTFQVLVIAEK